MPARWSSPRNCATQPPSYATASSKSPALEGVLWLRSFANCARVRATSGIEATAASALSAAQASLDASISDLQRRLLPLLGLPRTYHEQVGAVSSFAPVLRRGDGQGVLDGVCGGCAVSLALCCCATQPTVRVEAAEIVRALDAVSLAHEQRSRGVLEEDVKTVLQVSV